MKRIALIFMLSISVYQCMHPAGIDPKEYISLDKAETNAREEIRKIFGSFYGCNTFYKQMQKRLLDNSVVIKKERYVSHAKYQEQLSWFTANAANFLETKKIVCPRSNLNYTTLLVINSKVALIELYAKQMRPELAHNIKFQDLLRIQIQKWLVKSPVAQLIDDIAVSDSLKQAQSKYHMLHDHPASDYIDIHIVNDLLEKAQAEYDMLNMNPATTGPDSKELTQQKEFATQVLPTIDKPETLKSITTGHQGPESTTKSATTSDQPTTSDLSSGIFDNDALKKITFAFNDNPQTTIEPSMGILDMTDVASINPLEFDDVCEQLNRDSSKKVTKTT